MSLPESFCWSKFGVEAGEQATTILHRKDIERAGNDGLFLWGIGNSVGDALRELLERTESPELLLSPMLSAPALHDVHPADVVAWTQAIAINGARFNMPAATLVTSRWTSRKSGRAHFALVCSTPRSLVEEIGRERVDPAYLRNLKSGARLGASQVTAVVGNERPEHPSGRYPVRVRARLVPPFLVRLTAPVFLSTALRRAVSSDPLEAAAMLREMPLAQVAPESPGQLVLADVGAGDTASY